MTTTDRQLFRDYLPPFLFALFALTFILFLQQLFKLIDLLVSKGVSFALVSQVFINSLPFIISSTLPMAILVATIMTFGRMAQDNELNVIFASGIRIFRLLLPLLILNAILTGGLILFNNLVVPNSNHRVRRLMIQILRKRPTVKLRSGVFIDEFPGYTIYIGSIDTKKSEIKQVTIYEKSSRMIITAPYGTTRSLNEGNTIIFNLANGEMHEPLPDGSYRRVAFKRQELIIHSAQKSKRRESSYRGDREMTIGMLDDARRKEEEKRSDYLKRLRSLTVQALDRYRDQGPGGISLIYSKIKSEMRKAWFSQKKISRYTVEIQKKLAIPFAVILFLFLGAPLGYLVKRGGVLGGILAIGFFSLYYILLISGEELADRNMLPADLAIWMPNIVIGIISLHFYLIVDRGRGLLR